MNAKLIKNSRILNCYPSVISDMDFTFNNAEVAGFVKGAALPDKVDLRATWWEINNQGATGSCVGWATADGLLRWHFVKAGLIKSKEHLSVRFVWMSSKETDIFTNRPSTFLEEAGTSLKAALDIARNYGCVTDAVLPFASGKLYQGSESQFYTLASKLKILNYINLVKDVPSKTSAWKNWLAIGNGPILVRLDVDRTWYNASENQGNLDVYDLNNLSGGHAVLIVGYTKDRFIVRNSWGEEWGDKGFAYASYGYAEKAFTEAFGVNIR